MELALEILNSILFVFFNAIRITWWIFIPFILILFVVKLWSGWMVAKTSSRFEWALLEITPPPEVLKTPKAMENVFLGLGGGWTEHNTRDKYWRGSLQDMFSLEMVCNDNALVLYIRCQRKQISWVQSKFYSQYPESEIREVEDYAKKMPDIIPNDKWDMWGSTYVLVNEDWSYPIRTYLDWEDVEEDRRISPFSQLGEIALNISKDEYAIVQVMISPRVMEEDVVGHAKKTIDKILGRDEEKSGGGIFSALGEFVSNIFRGVMAQEMKWDSNGGEDSDELGFKSPFFNLTDGDRKKIEAIEMKDSKLKFATNINGMYIYKKGIERRERIADLNGFMRQFGNETLNGLRPGRGTYPSSNPIFFNQTRNRLRMRRLYFSFKTRWMGYIKDSFILNTEELASIYHIPGKVAKTSGLKRAESKMSEPPRKLPS